ncbi:MAG: hypothetical protein JWO13_2238 [Acidobacteriales bacterium]|nr:hypothetical protein [Terriglobales bacterium]
MSLCRVADSATRTRKLLPAIFFPEQIFFLLLKTVSSKWKRKLKCYATATGSPVNENKMR